MFGRVCSTAPRPISTGNTCAVLAPSLKVHSDTHSPCFTHRQKTLNVSSVAVAFGLRHQSLYRCPTSSAGIVIRNSVRNLNDWPRSIFPEALTVTIAWGEMSKKVRTRGFAVVKRIAHFGKRACESQRRQSVPRVPP
jgi:hypothetical protein